MQYTIVILVKASHKWLSMPRVERDAFVAGEIRPILNKYSDSCSIRLFDCDFTHPDISDFFILETADLVQYDYLIGYLRESATFAVPYFEVKNIVIGVPNNFRGSMNLEDVRSSDTEAAS